MPTMLYHASYTSINMLKTQIFIALWLLRRNVSQMAGPVSAPGQQSFEETSQRGQGVGVLTYLGFEPQTNK